MEEKEIWKLLPNSKGYCVSNFGRIKRLTRKVWNPNNNSWNTIKEHEIQPNTNNSKGYERVQIYYKNNNKKVTEFVHRLVALLFVVNPNIDKFNQVNHLDGNKTNNHWKNLQWCTNQMNMSHSWNKLNNRKRGKDAIIGISSRKLTENIVKSLPELLKTKSITEVAKELGVSVSTISEIKSKRSWTWLNLNFN